MKKLYTTALLLSVFLGFSQIPAGYYNSATGTGYTLKTQLYNIIKGHTDRTYNGLWTTYGTSDRDHYYENDNTILDIYSEKPAGPDAYSYTYQTDQCGNYTAEGACYNREHTVPQSVFGSQTPMYSDAHHIPPTDGYVNNRRDNWPHGVVGTATWTSTNGSKLGSASNSGYAAGYTGTVFEPIDEFKGDIARMYFYFATRYENTVSGYTYAMFNGTSNQVFTTTFLRILYTWHTQDPVSQREIDRNNAIYARQNNRNPYIDHPEYVQIIWGPTLATDSFEAIANVSVYPNPSTNHTINIYSEKELDEIQLINISGQIVQQIKKPAHNQEIYTLNELPQGFYLLRLSSENQSTTKKIIIN